MAEKPILFNTEMVKAILDGRKTQTRRIIKPQPTTLCDDWEAVAWKNWSTLSITMDNGDTKDIKNPYGKPNHFLWVREAWRIVGWHEGEPYRLEYKDGTKIDEPCDSSNYDPNKYMEYEIQCTNDCIKSNIPLNENTGLFDFGNHDIPTRWRPSIHMPRWASRILLKINDVRVERVQDISEEDAVSEGVSKLFDEYVFGMTKLPEEYGYLNYLWHGNHGLTNKQIDDWEYQYSSYIKSRDSFSSLWESINGKRGYGWEANPWVWVIEFEVINR